ncbi:MAG: MarR family winged helix-turn-helix transcriptional regulator [Cyclobacteriaceae bacterium]
MKLEEEILQREFLSENHKALVNILYTHSYLINRLEGFFKTYGITRQQFNVLRILRGQQPGSVQLNLIKDRMLDKMSDASRIVERLRIKGLIIRKQSKNDRRAVDISISPKGLQLLDEADQGILEFYKLFNRLSEDELSDLNKLLDKLRAGLK